MSEALWYTCHHSLAESLLLGTTQQPPLQPYVHISPGPVRCSSAPLGGGVWCDLGASVLWGPGASGTTQELPMGGVQL